MKNCFFTNIKTIYSPNTDLSIPESAILAVAKEGDLNTDIFKNIYEQLDPLENALVFLTRATKKYLRGNSLNYEITGEPYTVQHEGGTTEVVNIFFQIKKLEDNKINITHNRGSEKRTKTYDIDDFLRKTRELASAISNHQKIHQIVLEINPQLNSSIISNQQLTDFEYLNRDLTTFRSYINPKDKYSKTTLYSEKTILEINSYNTFKFKHIDKKLTSEEFYKEVERMKKISELTRTAEELFKDSVDCKIKREPNANNLLLPIISIVNGKNSYVINNGFVTIKTPEKETVRKPLEEFIANFRELTPSSYPRATRGTIANQDRLFALKK